MSKSFNPVKDDTSGVKARRMIWSSTSLDLALKGIEQGKKLIANPFYENNTKLLKGDLVFERTNEEINEWKRCKNDIIYFVEKYCQLMTPEGIKHVKLRDYQKKYLKHLEDNRLSIYLACRQCAKCLSLLETIDIQFDDNFTNIDDKLKKYFDKNYYIKEKDCYRLPMFELYDLFDNSIKWKIKYHLYKFLYKYDKGRG